MNDAGEPSKEESLADVVARNRAHHLPGAAAAPVGGAQGRTFAAVTTCHAEGWQLYGRDMVESFLRYWPPSVSLYLYAEGFAPDLTDPRVVWLDLLGECPELVAFKERHRENPMAHGTQARHRWEVKVRIRNPLFRVRKVEDWGCGYRWDAVRFSHKPFAIFDAARRATTDVLFWIDADIRVFADVPLSFLEAVMPPDCFISYLRRPRFSECGFVGYNLRHPGTRVFLAEFERLYTTDALFKEREFHDSFLFDVVRRRLEGRHCAGYDIGQGIGDEGGHVFVNSPLGQYMDHMKGERKAEGRSRESDLIVTRDEDYWHNGS
ncbi:MAG: hypothetical protein U1E42_15765 [Rhodospirillales bacterium]